MQRGVHSSGLMSQTLLPQKLFSSMRTSRRAQKEKLICFFCNECNHVSPCVRFTTGHIWACPPSEGDDYIFHCHPADQKIPKPKRLQEWYKKMLDKAVAERIVHDYKVRRAVTELATRVTHFLSQQN